MPDLIEMHTYARPAASKTERRFIRRFIDPMGAAADNFGNRWLKVGDAPVIWSAHTDTVHNAAGRQHVWLCSQDSTLALPPKSPSTCLGADNTAGVWMLLEMIEAGVPGLYIFHRAEEIGGQGSSHITRRLTHEVEAYNACIAFDRMGTDDIITHQGGMTASDEFAHSLSRLLNMGHLPDPTGIFTDTANYDQIVPECTNIAVGFHCAHTAQETLNLTYLYDLRDQVVQLTESDLRNLVIQRQPGEDDLYDPHAVLGHGMFDHYAALASGNARWQSGGLMRKRAHDHDLHQLVQDHPDVATRILDQFGVDYDEFLQEVYEQHGMLPPNWKQPVTI